MPRKARIDAPGALQHIICRGIEWRKIFLNDVDRMIAQVSEQLGISIEDLRSPGKHPNRVKARSVAAYLAVRKLGMDGTTVGRRMG
jgi:chromosomal replication initiation ATPase DnaA